MNVEVRPIKTAAETALAASFTAAKRVLPGSGAVAALREDAFRRFETEGLPHRRVEEWKYTDLRALMREARPLAGAPDAAAKARAGNALATLVAIEARRIVFVDGAFVPELSDLDGLEPGLSVRSMAQMLAAADPQLTRPSWQGGAQRRRRGRAQHGLHGRRRGDPCRGRRHAGTAAPSRIRQCGKRARRGVRALAGRDREGRAGDAGRKPPRFGRERGPGERRARARGRRRGSCRSRQDHRRWRGRPARFHADGGDRRARALQRIPVHDRRRRGAQPGVRALRRGRHRRRHPRRQSAQGPPARRHHPGGRPRGGGLHQPRSVQIGARRGGPQRLPGQDHRAAARAEDRRRRWRRTRCFSRRRPKPTTSPSSKSSPTTCSAATARPRAISTKTSYSTSRRAASRRRRPRRC